MTFRRYMSYIPPWYVGILRYSLVGYWMIWTPWVMAYPVFWFAVKRDLLTWPEIVGDSDLEVDEMKERRSPSWHENYGGKRPGAGRKKNTFTVRLPKDTAQKLQALAQRKGLPPDQAIEHLVIAHMEAMDKPLPTPPAKEEGQH